MASAAASAKPAADELDQSSSMHRTDHDDHFKELKSIKKQLYYAADYFQSSYNKNHDTQRTKLVMESLKDYTLKALVNTVDHLGSMAYTINTNLLHHINYNINAQISRLDLRLSCLQQRVGTWREFAGLAGVSQQSLTTDTPRYHKRYTRIAENRFQPESANKWPASACSASPRLKNLDAPPPTTTRSPASFIWEEYFVSQSPDHLPPSPGPAPTPTYPLTNSSWKSESSSEASPNHHQHRHHNLIPLPHSASLLIRRPISPTHCYPIKRSSRQAKRTTSLPVERGTSWELEAPRR